MSEVFMSHPVTTKSGKISEARSVDVRNEKIKVGDQEVPVADSVLNYVVLLDEEKKAKEQKEVHSEIIRTMATKIRDFFVKKGTYLKTYRLLGNEVKGIQYAVDVMENDKYTVPKNKEDIENIKTLIGNDMFSVIFEESTIISIKKSVMDDEKKRKELSKKLYEALGADGIKEYFDRGTEWSIKKGLSEKIHTYKEDVQKAIKENITQAKDTIKDASSEVEKD